MGIIHEEWRPVLGLEGQYEVSNLGRVRSLDYMVVRRRGKPYLRKGRMLKLCLGGPGYMMLRLAAGLKYVHHLVLEAFSGQRPEGMEGCHNDGNRQNNRIENLRWGTPQSNQMDRARHGTSNRGERCAAAKLTAEQVKDILSSSERGCDLARRYGVGQNCICAIRKGRAWKHLRLANPAGGVA